MKKVNLRRLVSISMVVFFLATFFCTVTYGEEKFKGKTVNVNTATVEEFVESTPIPREVAENIVKYREEMGEFMVIEELLQVEGFTRDLLKRVKDFLILEGIGGGECTC
ncbi:MAG TPA: helix-hairpin-helix domain-containing protein [Syntrophales bacterium]|nr:helix-hairpin-helix domain-containing protein [Syntrophales bacterium]